MQVRVAFSAKACTLTTLSRPAGARLVLICGTGTGFNSKGDAPVRSVRLVKRVMVGAATVAAILVAAPVAHGSVIAATSVEFPSVVTVGQTGVAASITLENRNTTAHIAVVNGVCNTGDASPPCSLPESGITLVPACKQLAGGRCTAKGADPGVITLGSTASGRPGTACTGMTFDAAVVDLAGTVRFTPQPAGVRVALPGSGAKCTIDFTLSVLKLPTGDQDESTPETSPCRRHSTPSSRARSA